MSEKVYAVQEYIVKVDMGNPVDLRICVYHEDQTKLTESEIKEEAIGYAREIGLLIHASEIYEIENTIMEEK